MNPKNKSKKMFWYGPSEGFEARSRRRLQADLGVDQSTAETILRLRNQVVELQVQIQRLEGELTAHLASQQLRVTRYQEVYDEATWIELEFLSRNHTMPKPIFFGVGRKYLDLDGLMDTILPWEDGLRSNTDPGTFEWWYFDAQFEDGSTAVIVYATKPIINPPRSPAAQSLPDHHPHGWIQDC